MHRTRCQLLGSVSLDFVRVSEPSNMHRCRAFPFALARFSRQVKPMTEHSRKMDGQAKAAV